MKKIIKKKNGFTLNEILLITGLISLAFVGIYTTYVKTNMYMTVLDEAKNIEVLREGAITFSENLPSYASLNNTVLNNSDITPRGMRDGTPGGIISNIANSVTVSPTTIGGVAPNNAFIIQYTGVPLNYCGKLVAQVSGKFDELRVNGTVVKNASTGDYEYNATTLTSACGSSPASGATIQFVSVSQMMNSLANAIGATTPVVNSVRPNYSTPLVETAFSANPNILQAQKSRYWGASTTSTAPNGNVTITANGRLLGFNSDNAVSFSVSQRTVDAVQSGLNAFLKAHAAANGGSLPNSWKVPQFDNDIKNFVNAVALSAIADANTSGFIRPGGVPSWIEPYITDLKMYVGSPPF